MDLRKELCKILPSDRVKTGTLDRVAWSADASFYRALPEAVVFVSRIEEVRALFGLSRRLGIPVTFRAAGTSLSGQAVGHGILCCVTRDWKKIEVLENGCAVRVQPGVIAARVNHVLRRFGKRLGPDPASLDSCMMGGVLANNSSGMCCGVSHNAYRTLRGMSVLLPSGIAIDTRENNADEQLRSRAPEIHAGILELKSSIECQPELVEKIRRKYRIKNTMGYSLNAFLDHSSPAEILSHLMIGSEGTLGFIAEAELSTVPAPAFAAVALMTLGSVADACERVSTFEKSGAQAIELMDRACLKAVSGPEAPAALLVEYRFETESERRDCVSRLERSLAMKLTTDPREIERLWSLRKGALPAIGSRRKPGTSVIIEDVAVPADRLAEAVNGIRTLLDRNGYAEGVIFGHAKDGNLHFVLSQSFNDEASIARYERLMSELSELIVGRLAGSLKAEHGTGRNMAPFLELEWGAEALEIMKRVKTLLDPDGLLNPGVILNSDPKAHLKELKELPVMDRETDACMECGFCEPQCPSRELSLSPRQRIAVRREMARTPERRRELESGFDYAGIRTCAADGMCASACPVGIDTGMLIKRLRSEGQARVKRVIADWAVFGFAWLERLVGLVFLRKKPRLATTSKLGHLDYVYFPSCVNRVMGGELPNRIETVLARAGKRVGIPVDARGKCCGTAFQSKGFPVAAEKAADRTLEALWRWSDEGRLPVLVDASPCAQALQLGAQSKYPKLRILDQVELAKEVLPRLKIKRKQGRVALHPVCSLRKLGLSGAFEEVARRCAEEVFIPISSRCCGFAGDRGFLVPELTRSATQEQLQELANARCAGHYSTSTTCELAFGDALGSRCKSLFDLIEEVSR